MEHEFVSKIGRVSEIYPVLACDGWWRISTVQITHQKWTKATRHKHSKDITIKLDCCKTQM